VEDNDSARLGPLRREDVPELESVFAGFDDLSGFLPNAMLVMARRPKLVLAKLEMSRAILADAGIDRRLGDLVFTMASLVSGCRYCEAHGKSNLVRRGVEDEKIRALWEFETSPLFDEAERAALRFARDSATLPNAITNDHFVALRRHFSEPEIVDLAARSCQAAWINRWNDTMATRLEDAVLENVWAVEPDWDPGKHRADG
jgi:alkylhydroperoxidase family enzyme